MKKTTTMKASILNLTVGLDLGDRYSRFCALEAEGQGSGGHQGGCAAAASRGENGIGWWSRWEPGPPGWWHCWRSWGTR